MAPWIKGNLFYLHCNIFLESSFQSQVFDILTEIRDSKIWLAIWAHRHVHRSLTLKIRFQLINAKIIFYWVLESFSHTMYVCYSLHCAVSEPCRIGARRHKVTLGAYGVKMDFFKVYVPTYLNEWLIIKSYFTIEIVVVYLYIYLFIYLFIQGYINKQW